MVNGVFWFSKHRQQKGYIISEDKMTYQMGMLNQLSDRLGILESFTDPCTGVVYSADKKSKQHICEALGYKTQTNADLTYSLALLEKRQWQEVVSPTVTVYPHEISPFVFEMTLPIQYVEECISFSLQYENKDTADGSFWFHDMPLIQEKEFDGQLYQKRRVYLFLNAPLGYHQLRFYVATDALAVMNFIVAPEKCFMPVLGEKHRVFGFPIQLYALKSKKNWGIGDFSDLADMAFIGKKLGASLIGVNPLNALFADTPQDASPYCASSRLFLNPLYIDITAVAESKTSQEFQQMIHEPAFQKVLHEIKNSSVVQYEKVADLKYSFLKVLHKEFKIKHFDKTKKAITKRGRNFLAFQREKGRDLLCFATYQVIRNHFLSQGKTALWWEWGEDYLSPDSSVVRQFQEDYRDEIDLIMYQQFLADEQFKKVHKSYQKSKMPIGLYTDFPVGVGSNSAEVWSEQALYLAGVTAGAPPDMFNKKGQDWSLAPFNPIYLAQTGFTGYRKIVQAAMNGAGAIRIDHAFGLERLYLRVLGATGAYLKYPYKTLMGIVALESHRHHCLVVAEDLGTPPAGFCDKMAQCGALSFKIAHYQRGEKTYWEPQYYARHTLIATGTHDMPSYTAFWKGTDLELAQRMKTITSTQYKQHKANRIAERTAFVETFYQHTLPMPTRETLKYTSKNVPVWFVENVYRYLSLSNSFLLLVRLEDLLSQDEQINLPGTYLEYPNWRYKLPDLIENFIQNKDIVHVCRAISEQRPFIGNEME